MGDKRGPQHGKARCFSQTGHENITAPSACGPGFFCPDMRLAPGIDRGQGKKLEIVALIKVRALKRFDRDPGAP
jgi:hypothetical protein